MTTYEHSGAAFAPRSIPLGRPLLVDVKGAVFYLVFCFSGLIAILDVIPYRMAMASVFVIPLLLIYGIKLDRVLLAHMALVAIVLLSGLWNGSSPTEVLGFLRIPAFSYLMYRLVSVYVRPDNIRRIIRLCVLVAMIQLPLVVLQQLTYEKLPIRIAGYASARDFDFGTFNVKGDAAMAFFLTLLVVFLLFDRRRNYVIRRKWIVLPWLTLTVLIANAEGVKVIMLLVWAVYLTRYLNVRTIVYVALAFLLVIGVLSWAGFLDEIWGDFTRSLRSNLRMDERKEEVFLTGGYGRGAAIAYYARRGILWLGDGPSKYYNVMTRIRQVGNTGHVFTFYSEVGLLGWLCSVLVFFFIAFPGQGARIRVSWVGLLSFAAVQLLSFTTEIMNDISVALIYCIVAKSYLIMPSEANRR